MLRGKMATMKEYLSSAEVENKASRETIMRLVTEAEREQRSVGKFTLDLDNLRLVCNILYKTTCRLKKLFQVFFFTLDNLVHIY